MLLQPIIIKLETKYESIRLKSNFNADDNADDTNRADEKNETKIGSDDLAP